MCLLLQKVVSDPVFSSLCSLVDHQILVVQWCKKHGHRYSFNNRDFLELIKEHSTLEVLRRTASLEDLDWNEARMLLLNSEQGNWIALTKYFPGCAFTYFLYNFECNPNPFYSFRELKIRCWLDLQLKARFRKHGITAVHAIRTVQYNLCQSCLSLDKTWRLHRHFQEIILSWVQWISFIILHTWRIGAWCFHYSWTFLSSTPKTAVALHFPSSPCLKHTSCLILCCIW
jgi:hypothetical protein